MVSCTLLKLVVKDDFWAQILNMRKQLEERDEHVRLS